MKGGEIMKRLLKKLSSLCLAFVLGTSGFFGLSTNAACRKIITPEELEQSKTVKVVKLYNKEDRDVVVFDPLKPRPKLRIYLRGDEQKIRATVEYCQTHFGFTSIETALVDLLRENGEEELAERYEDYRYREIETMPVNRYVPPEALYIRRDGNIHMKVKAFFSKNRFVVDLNDPVKVGLYALIYFVPFDRVNEHIATGSLTGRR